MDPDDLTVTPPAVALPPTPEELAQQAIAQAQVGLDQNAVTPPVVHVQPSGNTSSAGIANRLRAWYAALDAAAANPNPQTQAAVRAAELALRAEIAAAPSIATAQAALTSAVQAEAAAQAAYDANPNATTRYALQQATRATDAARVQATRAHAANIATGIANNPASVRPRPVTPPVTTGGQGPITQPRPPGTVTQGGPAGSTTGGTIPPVGSGPSPTTGQPGSLSRGVTGQPTTLPRPVPNPGQPGSLTRGLPGAINNPPNLPVQRPTLPPVRNTPPPYRPPPTNPSLQPGFIPVVGIPIASMVFGSCLNFSTQTHESSWRILNDIETIVRTGRMWHSTEPPTPADCRNLEAQLSEILDNYTRWVAEMGQACGGLVMRQIGGPLMDSVTAKVRALREGLAPICNASRTAVRNTALADDCRRAVNRCLDAFQSAIYNGLWQNSNTRFFRLYLRGIFDIAQQLDSIRNNLFENIGFTGGGCCEISARLLALAETGTGILNQSLQTFDASNDLDGIQLSEGQKRSFRRTLTNMIDRYAAALQSLRLCLGEVPQCNPPIPPPPVYPVPDDFPWPATTPVTRPVLPPYIVPFVMPPGS